MKLDHDLNKVTNLLALIALKNEKGDFFLKTDILKQLVTLGCNHKHGAKARHSIEVSYDIKNETKGIFGQPVKALWAGQYQLDENVSFKTKFDFGKEIKTNTAWI